jgi:Tfp pilus assembly protein PilX
MHRRIRQQSKAGNERGTILVVTVVAMLILGILAISFAALGNLEVRIGLNDVWDKQAAFVAEGGIAAVRNQIQSPPNYTALLGHVYSCTTSACTCSGAGCGTAGLTTMGTGEFSVRIDNDPTELAGATPAVDANQRVVLTALGITRGATGNVMGRSRIRAWLTNDDPWDHVCASGDGTLCTDPPNNPNADIDPPDPNDQNGPRTYPQIPVPNQIRTTPCYGCAINVAAPSYPVPTGQTIPGAPYGPNVMYPYYLTALTTACSQCSPATIAYDPANPTCTNAATSAECLGLVRLDASVSLQRNPGGSGAKIVVPGQTLGAIGNGVTVYILGTLDVKGGVDFIYGTLVFHGDGVSGTRDLDFQGPHTVAAAGPACSTCSYPLVILGYNPNEGAPPSQTMSINISNNNVTFTGVVYTGGSVDLGPNTVNGSILGYQVNANNGATEYTYVAYEPLPPPGFSTPTVVLPSVVARGTWLQCRTAQNLTDPCD